MGICAALFEQLPAVSVNGQFFVHRRGYGISLYVLAATLGYISLPSHASETRY